MGRKCNICGIDEEQATRMINSPKYGRICSVCYQRERANSTVYDKPAFGEIAYDPKGTPICHICGKSYKKLMAHVNQVHKLTQEEYKKKFGLDLGKGIMCKSSTELARKRNKENYDTVVKQNLLEKGKETRFEEGHTRTKGKYVSEHTRRAFLSHRYVKKKKEV